MFDRKIKNAKIFRDTEKDIRQIAAQVFAEVMQDFFCHFETIEYAVFHTQRETASFDGFKKISGLKALH